MRLDGWMDGWMDGRQNDLKENADQRKASFSHHRSLIQGVFPATTTIAFMPVNCVYSVNTLS